MRDMINKGRNRTGYIYKGETNKNSKLKSKGVVEIRKIYATGSVSQKELAAQYSVGQTLISRVVRREIWRHV